MKMEGNGDNMKKKVTAWILTVIMAVILVCSGGVINQTIASPAAPRITSLKVSELSTAGYKVTAVFEAAAGVKEVLMPTWTGKNNQDDLIWHKASVSGNTATFYVPVSAHKGESGTYITHVYVRDWAGNQALEGVTVTVPGGAGVQTTVLAINKTDVSEVSEQGYRITITFEASAGVKEVLMPTWTEKNGQDDLIWHVASVNGNTATFYVSVSAHKGERGAYITHIYLRDVNGGQDLKGVNVTVPNAAAAPQPAGVSISDVKVSDITSSGYKVTATFSAPAGVKEVVMPTWTEKNGQDDLIWHAASVSGNTASFYVPVSAHKGESGAYITHIYVRDLNGKQDLRGVNVNVPAVQSAAAPAMGEIVVTEISRSGYRVSVEFSAPAGLREVLMPSWSTANGQDDLIWHKASINGNTASFYVSTAAHKGNIGEYLTHVYVYDVQGRSALKGVTVNTNVAVDADTEKVIIFGDSRTVSLYCSMIYEKAEYPSHMFQAISDNYIGTYGDTIFSAKGGEGYWWLKEHGFPAVEGMIDSKTTLVFWFGINDMEYIDSYIEFVNEKVEQYDIPVYYLTLGPCTGTHISWNTTAESFNAALYEKLDSRVHIIDMYQYINEGISNQTMAMLDNVHYSYETSRLVYQHIMDSVK